MSTPKTQPDLSTTRRSFLLGLAALGLFPLPRAAGEADADELIRHVEGQLKQNPLRFVVDHKGTIELADHLPDANRLAAYDVSPEELKLGEGLYDFLYRIQALRCEIHAFSQDVRDGQAALEDWDTEGVEEFIDSLQHDEREALRAHLRAWFSEEVSLEERDGGDLVRPVDGQHWAYRIFAEEAALCQP